MVLLGPMATSRTASSSGSAPRRGRRPAGTDPRDVRAGRIPVRADPPRAARTAPVDPFGRDGRRTRPGVVRADLRGVAVAPGRAAGRTPRLPVPTWDEVKRNLPPALAARPTRIVWNLVCSGYVPELAVPWSVSTRTMWAEAKPDRVFEESLFWVQTRASAAILMGHCEMLLEVAGLDKPAVAERTRRLAGDDWSSLPRRPNSEPTTMPASSPRRPGCSPRPTTSRSGATSAPSGQWRHSGGSAAAST